MLISDAKKLVGHTIALEYVDRKGEVMKDQVEVFDVNFIALYGPCMITDIGDIRLDRVNSALLVAQQAAA